LGSGVTDASGLASSTVSVSLNVGSYNGGNGLKATFAGDATPYAAQTKTVNFSVTPTTSSFSAISGSGIYGSAANLTATVNLNVAGLSINFTLDGTSVGAGTTNANGVATLNVPFGSIPASVKNAGTYSGKVGVSISGTGNYTAANATGNLTVTTRPITINVTAGQNKVYGTTDPTFAYTYTPNPATAGAGLASGDAFSGALTRVAGENVGTYNILQTGLTIKNGATDESSNYAITYNGSSFAITPRPITITPNPGQFKYCGQADPVFTFSGSETLLPGNSYSGALGRIGTNDVGTYGYTLGTLSAGNNYTLTLGGANTFEIKGVLIDASATSTAIQLGTASKTLTATVTSGTVPVNAATVTFAVTNNGNITPITVTAITDANGVATYNLSSGSLAVGLYQVTAVAGSGCSESVAYFAVYDPNAGFVTGGGWINSPIGAYSADLSLTGKANFGFNAQYKKGNNTPDGNTEFQFKAGNLNFKSTNYATGSLVIAGAKAIFQGTGTINGSGNYNFMISAIDGSISGDGVDKFRIKIQTPGGGVVYDNNMATADNDDPATVLGGGSIVIHSTGSKKSRIMDTVSTSSNVSIVNNDNIISNEGKGKLTIKVMPNPTSYYFTLAMKSLSKENVKLTVMDITGRVIDQRTNVPANTTIQLGDKYHPGIYIAEFLQGKDKITLRLIKEGK
jgi:hypothetical protein